MMMKHDLFYLANVSIPLNATWAQNATTPIGQANGTAGSSISYLSCPDGITITTDDILYVADSNNNRVMMVYLNSSSLNVIGSGSGTGVSQFRWPVDVFIAETFLYVADSTNNRIQKWTRNGTNPSTVPGAGTFNNGWYIFIDKDGNLYISINNAHKIIRFAPNSSVSVIVAGTGVSGSQANRLNTPYGVYVDENLTIYIADGNNNRIQMWTNGSSSGITVAGNGSAGLSLTQLNAPEAVTVDTNGYMYIADSGNNRIMRWAPNSISGVCIAACSGASGRTANKLNMPYNLAFDIYGSLYVTDCNNNRVQKFQILDNQSNIITFSWL
jgi:sugar lactone lactonase YvrE